MPNNPILSLLGNSKTPTIQPPKDFTSQHISRLKSKPAKAPSQLVNDTASDAEWDALTNKIMDSSVPPIGKLEDDPTVEYDYSTSGKKALPNPVTEAKLKTLASDESPVFKSIYKDRVDNTGYGTKKGCKDCSALTQSAYKAAGKNIPRTAQGQWKGSTKIDAKELTKGDLIFFNTEPKRKLDVSHVAIYNGDGTMTHTGSDEGVRITNLLSYAKKYKPVGFGRY